MSASEGIRPEKAGYGLYRDPCNSFSDSKELLIYFKRGLIIKYLGAKKLHTKTDTEMYLIL